MVTVVATQELQPGDVLMRFKEEAAQDEPRRGNNNNRYIIVGLVAVGVWKLSLHMGFFSLVCCVLLLLFIRTRVMMMMICTAFLVMFGTLHKVALACW